ncbi:MAG: methyltransferase domain-containing protein [Bacteroidetes bacterium]|nr:methyltransferase domain-containing protein [Bacteroidota bacterium]
MTTDQLEFWKSEFGDNYILREGNVVSSEGTRRLMRDWGRMLIHAVTPKPETVLEVGCNVGRNLMALRHYIKYVHAVEPNEKAYRAVRKNPDLNDVIIHNTDGFSLPYDDNSIDLVFTSGVLIHVSSGDLDAMIEEINRVAAKYILCIEYFSHEPVEIKYHGHDGYLFKRDFGSYYLNAYPSLRVLDYGFLWQPLDSSDNSNWWLFEKTL